MEGIEGMFAIIDGLCWESDFCGHECGFPDVDAIGYYTKAVNFYGDDETMIMNLYVNAADGHILAMWLDPEDGDEDWQDNDEDDEEDFY